MAPLPTQLLLSRRSALLAAMGASLAATGTVSAETEGGVLAKLRAYAGDIRNLPEDLREEVAYIHGMEAYAYGFPLVMMDVTRAVTTATPTAGQYAAPINQFARMRTYVDPDFKNVVRISRSSLWSFGFVDLKEQPIVFTQPDTKGRYVVTQLLNMWTDDFASIGSRTTGTGAGNFLIAGPGWAGTAPADVKATFRSPTRFAWVLTQMACGSPDEYAAINALQDGLALTPLSAWGKDYKPPATLPVDATVDLTATPYDQLRLMTGRAFFQRLASLLTDNPPYEADKPMLATLRKIGIEPGKAFDPAEVDPVILKGLDRVPNDIWGKLTVGPYSAPTVNGWQNPLNLGRYGTDYETRALIAWLGLGALTSDDAVYPSAFVDGNGQVLDGAARYVVHFDKDQIFPSHSGVWSISAYRENFYVRNAIERYGLLSSMPLKYNPDGSLDVFIQNSSPGPEKESNWLPCPPSLPFNVTVRVYQPKPSLLDGTYKLPPLVRV